MNKSASPILVAAFASALFGIATAAPSPRAAAPAHGLFQAPAQGRPAFGATVSRVRVDVIVTDEEDQFVEDLVAEEFRVFEDGVQVEILDVQLVDLASGEVERRMSPTAPAAARQPEPDPAARRPPDLADRGGGRGRPGMPAPSADASPATAAALPQATAAELGAMIFLIDGPSLSNQTKARFAESWRGLLEQTEPLQVPRAAYLVDNVGRIEELAPLSRDLERLQGAAEAVAALPLTTESRLENMVDIMLDLGDEDLAQQGVARARGLEAAERSRSLAAYELLTGFCDALATRSGRTAVVWISSGIKLMSGGPYTALVAASQDGTEIAAESQPGTRNARWDLFSPDPMIRREQERLHRAANSANVSIYSIDPTPLAESRLIANDARIQQGGSGSLLGSNLVQGALDGMRDSLRNAAQATGGQAFIHATDLELALSEIERDTSHFYLLTYAPPPPEGDGEFHDIRVEVARDRVDVRARGGYVDHPPAERIRRLVNAALQLPGSVIDLPVAAQTFLSWGGEAATVMLAVAVDAGDVAVYTDEEGARRASLDIHWLVTRGADLVEEVHEGLYARSGGATGAAAAPAARPPAAGADEVAFNPVGYLVYRHEVELEPGQYELRVAVIDNTSGRVGATQLELEVPVRPAGWHAGNPVLVAIEPSGAAQPVVHGRVAAGREIVAYLEVYGGQRPVLTGQVFNADAPEQGATDQSARLIPIPFRQVAPNLHRGAVPLPALPPGDYTVQFNVTDPVAEQYAVLRVPFRISEPEQR